MLRWVQGMNNYPLHYDRQHPGRTEPTWVADLKPAPSTKVIGIGPILFNRLANPKLLCLLVCQHIGGMGGTVELPFESYAAAERVSNYVKEHGVLPVNITY